ncbi:MAG TPA: VWA domain-containing protein [Vicinamibacterales bacterium]|nr:VWA domain-containing protein [Vicinamibacterales bacterium]
MAECMLGRLAVLTASASAALLLGAGPVTAQGTSVPASAPAQEQTTRFKSAVDLVSVTAVVRDRKGRFVPDLSREDFIVVEGGERRPIVGFNSEADGPVRVAVLFDISGSMRVGTKAVDARQAARHIFSSMKDGDQAALFAFDTQLDKVTDFTKDFKGLEAKLDKVEQPFGQTSLYDAIAETARAVGATSGGEGKLPQRAAIVVLTDGVDTKSRLTAPEVSAIASSIDVPVYIVAVMSPVDDPRNADYGTGSMSSGLTDLARWTGGDIFIAISPAHTSIAARQIVSEMRHQYMLAFEASMRPGWRPLEVRARDRDFVVRARSGYTAGGGTPPPVDAAKDGAQPSPSKPGGTR